VATSITRHAVGLLSAAIPLRAVRLLAFGERALAALQGKGAGSRSVLGEVKAALGVTPGASLVCFDGGANRGAWSRALLETARDRVARVVALEPSPTHRSALASIADPRFTYLAVALSDADCQKILHSDRPGSELASLSLRRLHHVDIPFDHHEIVEARRLDSLCSELRIDRIDLLKLDVEGHELDVLKGAEEMLHRGAIRTIAFEFGGCNIDSRTFFQDFWYRLAPLGYNVGRILPSGRVLPIPKYSEALETFTTTNYLAWGA